MQNAVQFSMQPSLSTLPFTDPHAVHASPIVAMNPAWRKMLTQAEMVAPYLQIATIEGEHSSGKQTLAHFLHSRSAMARSPFQRHDAREWLVTDADPSTLTGFTYLNRVDLLASPGQGLLLGALKALQGWLLTE
jgi:hypothetical protein